jgi:hypothetical protein
MSELAKVLSNFQLNSILKSMFCFILFLSSPWLLIFQADVALNRKVLSELAVHEPRTFQTLAEFTKSRMDQAMQGLKLLSVN